MLRLAREQTREHTLFEHCPKAPCATAVLVPSPPPPQHHKILSRFYMKFEHWPLELGPDFEAEKVTKLQLDFAQLVTAGRQNRGKPRSRATASGFRRRPSPLESRKNWP